MKICLNNKLDVRYNLHHKWLVYQIKLIFVWWWTKNPKSTYLIFFCISPIKTDKKKSKSFFFANRQEAPLFKGLSNGIDIYGSAPITMAYGLLKKISLPYSSRKKKPFFFIGNQLPGMWIILINSIGAEYTVYEQHKNSAAGDGLSNGWHKTLTLLQINKNDLILNNIIYNNIIIIFMHINKTKERASIHWFF